MSDVIGLALLIALMVVASMVGGQWINDRAPSAVPTEEVPEWPQER